MRYLLAFVFILFSNLPKLLIALMMLLCTAIAWGQENQIKSIHHIEASYYTEGGYAMRKVNVDYRKRDGLNLEPGKLIGMATKDLPLIIDERTFLEAFNLLIQSAYTPFVVEETDIAQCEKELYPDDIFHWNDPGTHFTTEEFLDWVHSLVGLPEDSLQSMVWDKDSRLFISIRSYSDLKVFYTENDYIELCYDEKLSPFSHILEWHPSGDEEVKGWHPINDDALHSFYTATGLSILDLIPSKAEILIALFQGIPNHK